MVRVTKRDGKVVEFDINRVINAVMAAQSNLGKSNFDEALSIAMAVQDRYINEDSVTIAEIQGMVEDLLMVKDPEVARKYIEYRAKRDRAREEQSPLAVAIRGLVEQTDESILKENANKDAKVFPVQRDLLAGVVSKHFARNYILPRDIVNAHERGEIHYHDLDYSPFLPMTNCCLVDLKGMLENGFKLGNAQIESPKSIGVACAVMAQITAQVASHQYGGTTFANVDQVLAPYAEITFNKHMQRGYDWGVADTEAYARELTAKEIYDGIQAYEYEINTLFTTNGQQPFVTVTFGMGTSWFEREIQRAILKVRIKGLGAEGLTAVFPKLVMFMDEGINLNPEDPNYDIKQLALECSSKRLYPDIISAKANRSITGSSVPVSPMGCRSFLSVWKDGDGNEVLDGRNNLGVVSLNLPRIAIESGGDWEKFYTILDERLDLAKRALDTRIERLRGVKAAVAPILYTEGAFGVRLQPDDDIINIFKHGRSSISLGYIGLHEVGLTMQGIAPTDDWASSDACVGLVAYLRKTVDKWKDESEEGWGYSLYATPSESLCDRFCRLDKEQFGSIDGVTNKDYYTNSFHQDVYKHSNPFDKIDFEAPYHYISSAGHISYAEFPNVRNNTEGLETVWDYAMSKLSYFGTNTPSDKCLKCHFEGEFKIDSDGFHCPSCGNHDSKTMSVIRRVCGYLGSPNARGFNHGKNEEVIRRVKHV
ncbi:anaerobic ribonucleoside reductase large subunit [Cronobacter phage A24]|uniref:Anaerobic ribonucleoside-triphosphate reductase n=1 Tax=Cronobacter phage A24 TaxID=2795745 RepID=A0A7T5QXV7_9CAUD|nr:anaerobic ribonucleoside reductase large subunit [Cronobacter phage A24]QQG33680.1 anaerobic ribonucleoside-triphosphate reductase [Cronobacter phage A24]